MPKVQVTVTRGQSPDVTALNEIPATEGFWTDPVLTASLRGLPRVLEDADQADWSLLGAALGQADSL